MGNKRGLWVLAMLALVGSVQDLHAVFRGSEFLLDDFLNADTRTYSNPYTGEQETLQRAWTAKSLRSSSHNPFQDMEVRFLKTSPMALEGGNSGALAFQYVNLPRIYEYFVLEVEANEPGRGLLLPGVAEELSIWVWANNTGERVDLIVQDTWGFEHSLSLGKMKHLGWKLFRVPVLSYNRRTTFEGKIFYRPQTLWLRKIVIQQGASSVGQERTLYFAGLIVKSKLTPDEIYDGYRLEYDRAYLQELWEEELVSP